MAKTSSSAESKFSVDVESSDFLRQVSGLAPGVIYVFNHRTKSNEYANRSIAELLGFSSEELIEMGDSLIERTVHPEDLSGLVAYFDSLAGLQDGETASFEYRACAQDDATVWLRNIDAVFQRAEDGTLLRHIGIAIDITAQKSAERALLDLNAELELRVAERTRDLAALNNELEDRVHGRTKQLRDLNRELEQLSYLAAHDLKAPIDNLSGLADMLAETATALSAEQRETIDWMQRVCAQASDKLEAIVRVAQADAVLRDPFTTVDLTQVFQRVKRSLDARITESGACIETDFQCPRIFFLPHEMAYILQSMLCNTLNYRAEDRPLHVTVRSACMNGWVRLSVTDNGTGFDPRIDRARVFGLFQRAHATPAGAGVSLYSISRILQQIGGAIEATSQPGAGSTFTVWVPDARRDGTAL